jgi:putative polyhydroxyalkanoate system protein
VATIETSKQHTLGKAGARARAEKIADELERRIQIEWAWTGDRIDFAARKGMASGVKGKLDVTDSEISIAVDLPLLLRPLAGMVRGHIQKELDAIS